MKQTKQKFTISNFFKFQTFNTTLKKELIGGLSTFLALIYIVSVQESILSGAQSIHFVTGTNEVYMNGAEVFLASAIIVGLSTIIMGLSANVPIALSPGMGLNAMFTFNVANKGLGYEGALIAVTLSSILFLIFATTKLRKWVMGSIPSQLQLAMGVGLGFFVAYVGLSGMHWVKAPGGVPVAEISNFKTYYPAIIIGSALFFLSMYLSKKNIIGAVAISIGVGLVISLILANAIPNDNAIQQSLGEAKWHGWNYDKFNSFGTNIKNTWTEFTNVELWKKPTMYISIFLFMFICVFDSSGVITIVNLSLVDENRSADQIQRQGFIANGVSAMAGGLLGTSPVIVTLESNIGIQQGARTGLASVITGSLYLLLIPLYPLFTMIPMAVVSSASLFVGSMMILSIKDIQWSKINIAASSFLMILFMIVTYSITNGVGAGIVSYTILSTFSKEERKELNPGIIVLTVVFILYFISLAFF